MKRLILSLAVLLAAVPALAAPPRQDPVPFPIPREPKIRAHGIPGGVIYHAWNAYEVFIQAYPGGPIISGDMPLSGFVELPPGTYCFTAVGDRNRTTYTLVTVPKSRQH